MRQHTRRTFLASSGALLGGVAASGTAVAERSDRYVVDVKRRERLSSNDLTVIHDIEPVGVAVVEGPEAAAAAVGTAAPDLALRRTDPVPNGDAPTVGASATDEPLYDSQWDKQAQDIPAVHDVTRGEGTRVAVIDTGVAAGHPDLEHAVAEDLSRNFSGDSFGAGVPAGGAHGTHVAGIVAADDRNETGVVGTAPGAEIVDCRVFAAGGGGASFGSILAAIVYATEIDCDVANLSLGAYGPRRSFGRKSFGRFYGKLLNATLTYATAEGTFLSIAAGNDAADLQHDKRKISLPNEGAQAVSVSATGPVGFGWGADGLREPTHSPARYTNYGTNAITLAAPGGDYSPAALAEANDGDDETVAWYRDLVLNCVATPEFETDDDGNPTGYVGADYTYDWLAGTSMAAPQVAGAAALVASVNPGSGPNRIEATLKRTASVPDGYDRAYYGAGVIDPLAAVRD